MNQKSLQEENKKLKEENLKLREVLGVVKLWMQKEMKGSITKIAKRKVSKFTRESEKNFLNENISEIITKKINDFFSDIFVVNVPFGVIDNIISAEINYYNLNENPILDGVGIVIAYQKALDILVEKFITKGFRKFAIKNGHNILKKNEPIEKTLNSVVNKGYILGVSRLFHILKLIKNEEKLYGYGTAFKEYLEKYTDLKNILLHEKFYSNLSEIVESEILGKKRHSGKISFVETRVARKIFIGNFKNKDCLIYMLMKSQNLGF